MSEPILSIRGLERTYQTVAGPLTVLRDVDLDLRPGEIVGLIGPSGSGKSSLLHAAGLLEHPNAGRIEVLGRDCSDLGERERTQVRLATIGFVYQFHHLLPEFSTCDNVALPQMIAGKSRKAARQRATTLLSELGLADRLDHQPVQAFRRRAAALWPWRGPSPTPLGSCWPTSLPATSIPPPQGRCSIAYTPWPAVRVWPPSSPPTTSP